MCLDGRQRFYYTHEMLLLRDFSCELLDDIDDECSKCHGYRCNTGKLVLYYIFCVLSAGLLFVVSYWKPEWKLKLTHSPCVLRNADTVLIIDQNEVAFVKKVKRASYDLALDLVDGSSYSYFWYKHHKFCYYDNEESYRHVGGLNATETFHQLTHNYHGITNTRRENLLQWFGRNSIDVKIKSIAKLFLEESADPFYGFQLFSCILWFSDEYYYYAATILAVSLGSIVISVYQTRKHLKALRSMIAKSGEVTVMLPDGQKRNISSLDLVPGDVLVVHSEGGIMHCDAVLISGTAIVNESMLTGESSTVTKTEISKPTLPTDLHNETYDTATHKQHTLFSGTEVLQTRCYHGEETIKAIVVKTGFSTMKGNLLRSILFPKPIAFQFFNDAMRFICVLGLFAVAGLVFSLSVLIKGGASAADVVIKSLDVITIVVPPALPAAMSVGTVYALQRLKKCNIFCIDHSRVNVSAKIKLFCFDKTGTLTKDSLDFCGFIPSAEFTSRILTRSLPSSHDNHIVVGMASCHSLTVIKDKITGDPLDVKMFEATGWDIDEGGEPEAGKYGAVNPIIVKPKSSITGDVGNVQVAILKHFTFSSQLQRMGVVVGRLGSENMEVYVKGSPEVVATLCDALTLPPDYDECLKSYTKLGYRVLALAYKSLDSKVTWHDVQQYHRDQAESGLSFLGFLVMKNVLKPETTPVIQQLYKAEIRVVMVTGDNILTAVCVARECGMVKPTEDIIHISSVTNDGCEFLQFTTIGETEDQNNFDTACENVFEDTHFLKRRYHFAVTGKIFSLIQSKYPHFYSRLLVCGTIFARMLPDQKTALVEGLQSLGYGVGMCGDGANDCGALKRAHAGISLSELEASVASPFTSKTPNISCVIELIKEGRCALVTSFNIFKYMALYSMIQFTTALALYSILSNLGDLQYLYIDLFIITPFAVTMSRTGPAKKLAARRPLGRLMHPFVLSSMTLQILLQFSFQMLLFFYVKTLPDYKGIEELAPSGWSPGDGNVVCYEGTALFTLTIYQYIVVALVFSVGPPYRQGFYKNVLFLLSGLVLTAFNCSLAIKPNLHLRDAFDLLSIDDVYYYMVFFSVVLFHLYLSYFTDHIFLELPSVQRFLKWLRRKKEPRNKYKLVLQDIADDSSWPPDESYTHISKV